MYEDTEIEIGDFVASRWAGFCCGIVRERAVLPMGRQSIHGYMVELADGRRDFIPEEAVRLVAPSDEHFKRLAQEWAATRRTDTRSAGQPLAA